MPDSSCRCGAAWLLPPRYQRCLPQSQDLLHPLNTHKYSHHAPSHPLTPHQEQEGDDDEEAAEAEAEALDREPKKKVLKPPGYKKPPMPKPRPKPQAAAAGGAEGSEGGPVAAASGGKGKRKGSQVSAGDYALERRTVRESTRQKVEEGEVERRMAEKVGAGGCWWVLVGGI